MRFQSVPASVNIEFIELVENRTNMMQLLLPLHLNQDDGKQTQETLVT